MRTVCFLRTDSQASEEDSGCESEGSQRGGRKKVHFCGFQDNETEKIETHSVTDIPSKNILEKQQKCERKSRKRNGLNGVNINRGDIPDGSDIFRLVLKEIQTEDSEEEEVVTPRSDCVTPTSALKSILKKK